MSPDVSQQQLLNSFSGIKEDATSWNACVMPHLRQLTSVGGLKEGYSC